MFKCGTTCLDDKNSIKESEKCINNCSRHINKAMGIIQKEVNAFQVSSEGIMRYLVDRDRDD